MDHLGGRQEECWVGSGKRPGTGVKSFDGLLSISKVSETSDIKSDFLRGNGMTRGSSDQSHRTLQLSSSSFYLVQTKSMGTLWISQHFSSKWKTRAPHAVGEIGGKQ